jgi:hypothetical protein
MGYKSKKSLSILQIFGYMLEHLEAIEKLFGNFFKIFISGKKISQLAKFSRKKTRPITLI